jgi:hypothetical protein
MKESPSDLSNNTEMAVSSENTEIPLPPVPDVNPEMPWIQLGEFEVASSKTPPPKAYSTNSKPAERAAARFGVHGNAVCMGRLPSLYDGW